MGGESGELTVSMNREDSPLMFVVKSREMSVPLAYVSAAYATCLVTRKLMVKITFAYSLTA